MTVLEHALSLSLTESLAQAFLKSIPSTTPLVVQRLVAFGCYGMVGVLVRHAYQNGWALSKIQLS